tara:strand:+ start:110 stop:1003 length:894 start_codon:yes stop_codon:yes gene_type:complete
MKVTIIGSNGFLTKSIASYCNLNNFDLVIVGRSEPKTYNYKKFYKIDLLDDEIPYEEILKSEIIIYAAGAGIQSNLNESFYHIYELNTLIPVKICNNLKSLKFNGSFVSFGSYFEIGPNRLDNKYDELKLVQSDNKTNSDYSISKRMITRFLLSSNFCFTAWHFILPTIYGEYESNHRLIPYVIKSIKNNTKLKLTTGTQVRQYIYVNEIPKIIFQAVSKKINSGIYNIEGTETLSVKDLVSILHKLYNKKLDGKIFGEVSRSDSNMEILKLNGEKLVKEINYKPVIKISDVYEKYK